MINEPMYRTVTTIAGNAMARKCLSSIVGRSAFQEFADFIGALISGVKASLKRWGYLLIRRWIDAPWTCTQES